jgi:hypothetical protein
VTDATVPGSNRSDKRVVGSEPLGRGGGSEEIRRSQPDAGYAATRIVRI